MALRSLIRLVLAAGFLAAEQFVPFPCQTVIAAEPPLVVHEWGTFTAFEDAQGIPLLGINVDTEPVPGFVHNLGRFILNDAVLSSQHWVHRQKAVPRHHPQVTLRLETPVIYFYPPAGRKLPFPVDVDVKFRGGWLTEFYPQPDVVFPVVRGGKFNFADLSPETMGHITWPKVQIGTDQQGPTTNHHVWLAPRDVAAANLTSKTGEHEKYLFYRGVARQQPPLKIVTEQQGQSLRLTVFDWIFLAANQQATFSHLWLMEARSDGKCAYRSLPALTVVNDGKQVRQTTAARRFSEAEFATENRARLEAEMNTSLLAEGLFADEAKALLSTWQQAYFTSPGLRVFYTVPREWTDYYLPLTISEESRISRVMIGRIELISDHQRELLDALARHPVSKGDWLAQIPVGSLAYQKLMLGQSDASELVPSDFKLYLDLGRFRNALIAAEEQRTKSPNLARFIQEYRLEPFQLAQESGK